MGRNRLILGALVGLLSACGSSDRSGKDQARDAIDDLFTRFRESMLKGEPLLDASLFSYTPSAEEQANPAALPMDSSKTVTLGEAANDGTQGMEVAISNTFMKSTDGTGTITTSVKEKATSYEFLHYVATVQQPSISYTIPDYGLDAIAEDGTGEAFIVITLASQGGVTRTFNNQNPDNGHTLVNFGDATVPSGTASGSGGGTIRQVGLVVLTRTAGKLEARMGRGGALLQAQTVFQRAGGPMLSSPDLTFPKLNVGSAAVGADYVVAVGSDFPGRTGVAADASVDLSYMVTGVSEGFAIFGTVTGPFDPPMAFLPGPSGDFNAALMGLENVGDGHIQVDANVELDVFISEERPELEHSISDEDLGAMDLFSSAYLSSFAAVSRSIIVMH